jgi:D-glycero-D-manno-heptose 1,7-bisphosphate phosphatase
VILEVHTALGAAMEAVGARLDGVYYCPHHPDVGEAPYRRDCDCRKPRPGLLRRAAAELGADLARSFMVGDRHGDLATGWSAGARGVLVKTGYGLGELAHHSPRWPRPPELVAEHALDAVERVLSLVESEARTAP